MLFTMVEDVCMQSFESLQKYMHAQSKWHVGCKTGKYIISFSYQNVYTKEILVGKVSQTGTPCNLFFCSGGSGEGPGEPCPPPPPPYFYAILRPKGPKNFFWRPNPPLSQGMDNRAPSLSEGPLFRDLIRQVRNLDEAGSVTYKMIKMLWIGLTVWPVSSQTKCAKKMLLALKHSTWP